MKRKFKTVQTHACLKKHYFKLHAFGYIKIQIMVEKERTIIIFGKLSHLFAFILIDSFKENQVPREDLF